MMPLPDPLIVLQQSPLDFWAQGDFFRAFMERIKTVGGVLAFTAIVVVPLYLSLYWWSKRHTVPVVALVLMGAAVFPILPAAMARVAWIIILLSGGAALFAIVYALIQ